MPKAKTHCDACSEPLDRQIESVTVTTFARTVGGKDRRQSSAHTFTLCAGCLRDVIDGEPDENLARAMFRPLITALVDIDGSSAGTTAQEVIQ